MHPVVKAVPGLIYSAVRAHQADHATRPAPANPGADRATGCPRPATGLNPARRNQPGAKAAARRACSAVSGCSAAARA